MPKLPTLASWQERLLELIQEVGQVDIRILKRDLTPFERLVAEYMCDGLSNSAIARETAHTEKVIENTISRMSRAFDIQSGPEINLRVLLALAYRAQFGDGSFKKLGGD